MARQLTAGFQLREASTEYAGRERMTCPVCLPGRNAAQRMERLIGVLMSPPYNMAIGQ